MTAGRKRTFDRDLALDKAMRLFWSNGYSATSISQLTTELEIKPPSLYAAFGNKEALFKEALGHYASRYVQKLRDCLELPSTLSLEMQLQKYFHGLVSLFVDDSTPKGCLYVKCVMESESNVFPHDLRVYLRQEAETVKQILSDVLSAHQRFNHEENEMHADLLLSLSYGLAIQAQLMKSEKELQRVADFGLKACLA